MKKIILLFAIVVLTSCSTIHNRDLQMTNSKFDKQILSAKNLENVETAYIKSEGSIHTDLFLYKTGDNLCIETSNGYLELKENSKFSIIVNDIEFLVAETYEGGSLKGNIYNSNNDSIKECKKPNKPAPNRN